MVDIRVFKQNEEILAASIATAKSTRFTNMIVHGQAADSAADVKVFKQNQEILALIPPEAKSTRFATMTIHSQAPDSAAEIHVFKQNMEILGNTPAVAKSTRLVTMTIHSQAPDAAADIHVHKQNFEVLARSFIPLSPGAIPALWELFAHNWADEFVLETRYSTAVSRAAESVSEDRTQRFQRPRRTVKIRWSEKGLDFKENLVRLMQTFRQIVDADWMIPIYGDKTVLTQNAASAQALINADFTKRRFFVGGRTVMVPLEGARTDFKNAGDTSDVHVSFIAERISDTQLRLSDNLPVSYISGCAAVFPLISVHPKMQVTFRQHHCRLWDVELEFEEKEGPTALPPTADDLPTGFDTYRDIPILRPRHDYTRPLRIELLREGSQVDLGRGRETFPRGEFPRVKHDIRFAETREIGWDYIRFFDTRRGRLRPFFLIDQEDLLDVVDLEPNFIEVRPVGSFTEFQKDMDFFGFMMNDGTCFVREIVTIQDVGNWRLTVADVLPVLDFLEVRQGGRAHLTRNLEDVFREEWSHCELLQFNVKTISLLEEKDVTLDP